MLHVITTVELHAGDSEAFLAEARRLAALAKAQPGCHEFDVVAEFDGDITIQGGGASCRIVISEKWFSEPDYEAHAVTPHRLEYLLKTKYLIRSQRMQVLRSD